MNLLSDRDLLAASADGVLSEDEQDLLAWPTPAARPAAAPVDGRRRRPGRRGRRTC